jgi:serine/threonine-protein kinase
MGQVYHARDSRLGRDVAIKTSYARFSEVFEREARTISALNHPNICQLYDVGPNYLVMELLPGPTLAERIRQGMIPEDEAIRIARQIAHALEAAHAKGIVHRDLKPGNIKILPDGTVKVLDFGLAKVTNTSSGTDSAVDIENSPTRSIVAGTQAGMVLGTAGYMSPEQARGKPVDKLTDVWAFGVVLYEMLAGECLFKGEDASETLAG